MCGSVWIRARKTWKEKSRLTSSRATYVQSFLLLDNASVNSSSAHAPPPPPGQPPGISIFFEKNGQIPGGGDT